MLRSMDPNTIRELLASHTDTLTPEIKAEEAFYRNTQCPMCGSGGCKKLIRAPKVLIGEDGGQEIVQSPFGMSSLPEGYAHCLNCGTDFNPHTGMVYGTDASIIHGSEGGFPQTP
jgi:hypothetical protein